MNSTVIAFLFSFLSVFGLIFVLRPVAKNVGLVDKPSSRKQHVGEIPLVGGLAIYVAVTLCSFVLTPFDAHYKIFLLSTSFMVLIGALDDYHDIDAKLRLIAQCLIGALMVFGADLYIQDLGNLFGYGVVELGFWGPLFTVLAVVTCINAFNMTDGVDGLVGVLSLNTFIALGFLAMISEMQFNSSITSMLVGAVVAFLFFNFGFFKQGRYKIFMGDAGSMLMGLMVIWLITYMTKSDGAVIRPITAVWIIAVPLMDMFSVMLRRVSAGHSPLRASRDHLHHLFLCRGFNNTRTTIVVGFISACFCSVAILSEMYQIKESWMAGLFLVCFAIYNSLMIHQFNRLHRAESR